MRNYIVLNGTNSSTIGGLLIQELAPISKPLIRTQIEEIDGRDGDIVTPLGFSAYDKEITVGLYGNFDINQIIAFFNSEGTVIFSNEPDKYYNYQIIDQIDFERLVRYRTAKVTMHCQPFKYSTTEAPAVISPTNNLMSIPDWSKTSNGLTLSVTDGAIHVSGTSTAATEFYVPITAMTLAAGSYTLSAFASGSGATAASIRVIQSVPSDAQSFGGGYVGLQNNAEVTKSATLSASTTYNYLWFYVVARKTMDFTVAVEMEESEAAAASIEDGTVVNSGNIYSRPRLTIYGSGDISVSLDGEQIFQIALGDNGYITIDTNIMEAYKDSTDNLKNRLVDGDYNNFTLAVGENEITFSGAVSRCIVENYSRWL